MISKKALGLIETVGLAAATEAADQAVKSANVELVGYELSKGGGMVTVKIVGDVGAVKAAVQAAVHSAGFVSKVVSAKVIARPSEQIEPMVLSPETVGAGSLKEKENVPVAPKQEPKEQVQEESTSEQEQAEEEAESESEEEPQEPSENEEAPEEETSDQSNITQITQVKEKKNPTCNLCKDVKCTRKKGEPKSHCIHEKNKNKFTAKENKR